MRKLNAVVGLRCLVAFPLLMASTLVHAGPPVGYCDVTLCRKLEAPRLAEWHLTTDNTNEMCHPAVITKADAVKNKKVEQSPEWRPDGQKPTRIAVTRVKEVKVCNTPLAASGDKARM